MSHPTCDPTLTMECSLRREGRHFAVYLFVHTKYTQKAGPFSVARLEMYLPFHNRLAYNRVHRRSASPLTPVREKAKGEHRGGAWCRWCLQEVQTPLWVGLCRGRAGARGRAGTVRLLGLLHEPGLEDQHAPDGWRCARTCAPALRCCPPLLLPSAAATLCPPLTRSPLQISSGIQSSRNGMESAGNSPATLAGSLGRKVDLLAKAVCMVQVRESRAL